MIKSFATILVVLAICLGSSTTINATDTKHSGLLQRLETSPVFVSSIENYILTRILGRIQTSKHTTDDKDENKNKIDKRRRNRRLEGTPTSAPVKPKKSTKKEHKTAATTESSGSMSSSGSSSSSSNNSSSGSTSSSSSTFTSSGGYSDAVNSTQTLSYINVQSAFMPFLSVAIAIGMIVVAVAFIRRDGDENEHDTNYQLKGSVHRRMQAFSNYMADMDGRSIDSPSVDSNLLPSRKRGPFKKLSKSLKKLFSKRQHGSSASSGNSSGIYSREETTTSVLVV